MKKYIWLLAIFLMSCSFKVGQQYLYKGKVIEIIDVDRKGVVIIEKSNQNSSHHISKKSFRTNFKKIEK